MANGAQPLCPICNTAILNKQIWISCPRCGNYMTNAAPSLAGALLEEKLGAWDFKSINLRSRLSHIIRCQQPAGGGYFQIDLNGLESLHLEDPLPSPFEQGDRLILWIGEHQPSASESAQVPLEEVSAWIGLPVSKQAGGGAGLGWLLDQQEIKMLLEERNRISSPFALRLKMTGWSRYEELTRRRVESRTAFMAMKFDGEVTKVVNDYFKPAVAKADFELRILTDGQPAGLIDDQIRVSLRRAKFVVADLTNNNNGAYWEAGFAEGLGCPVIYTCREDIWDHKDKEKRPHFDTNHLATIIWNPDKLDEAATKLTAMIRATFPDAKQTDN